MSKSPEEKGYLFPLFSITNKVEKISISQKYLTHLVQTNYAPVKINIIIIKWFEGKDPSSNYPLCVWL